MRKASVALLIMLWLATSQCGSSSNSGTEPPVCDGGQNGELVYAPDRAPIIFLPGLLASELGCGPDGTDPTNLWPGRTLTVATWKIPFAALGLVNTIDDSGTMTSRATSSDECGTVTYGGGTTAAFPPYPLTPLWCTPESRRETGPQDPCALSSASPTYNRFAIQMQEAIAGQADRTLTNWAWDWRLSPHTQAEALDQTILEVTAATGVKATVVAHSLGNILFREWIHLVEEDGHTAGEYVGRFLSVAGPWWGVPQAWIHPAYGHIQPGLVADLVSNEITIPVVQQVFSSFPGVYWLFPTQAYDAYLAATGEHWLATAGPSGRPSQWVEYQDVSSVVTAVLDTCPQSQTFPCRSGALYDAGQSGFRGSGFDRSGIHDFVGLVGAGLRTVTQVCHNCLTWPSGVEDGDLISSTDGHTRYRVRKTSGDGNIPLFSAIQGTDPNHPPGDQVDFFFTCGVDHVGLMHDQDVLNRTVPYLAGTAALVPDSILSQQPCEMSEDAP